MSALPPSLQKALFHDFTDPELLTIALTHSSLADPGPQGKLITYQRLEFLGDRVLSLVVADMLYHRFGKEREGDLAKRHTGLVRMETLADIARTIGLGQAVRLSDSESAAGGAAKPNILADVCEAVIGALYIDGGLDAAKRFIETHWKDRLETTAGPPQDPKSRLQEWAQRRGLPVPEYRIKEQEGPPHDPVFTVEVTVAGKDPVSATGSSKRAAEKAAATQLLTQIGNG